MQKYRFSIAIMLFTVARFATAQHGTAPNGYYPQNYGGDTFTGVVTSADDATQSITLEYTKGSKSETFTGRLDQSCSIPTKDGNPMKASDIAPGTDLTVYYNRKTTKVGDQRQSENVIIAVAFNSFNGKPISEASRKVYPCTGGHVQYQGH
jgi:hypothetical protein